MRRHGFTLIELLVVIAIIAILAAILFPVFAKAREKARQTSCLSNTKQIGLAFVSYCQDYDEMVPLWFYKSGTSPNGPGTNPINGWCCIMYPVLLDPYVKSHQIWRCPSRSGPYTTAKQVMGCTPHYGYACAFCRATRPTPPQFCDPTYGSLGAIQKPADMPVFGESANGGGTGASACGLSRTGPGICGCSWGGCATWYNAYPHNDGRNLVFADGHAKWYNKNGDTKTNLFW